MTPVALTHGYDSDDTRSPREKLEEVGEELEWGHRPRGPVSKDFQRILAKLDPEDHLLHGENPALSATDERSDPLSHPRTAQGA